MPPAQTGPPPETITDVKQTTSKRTGEARTPPAQTRTPSETNPDAETNKTNWRGKNATNTNLEHQVTDVKQTTKD